MGDLTAQDRGQVAGARGRMLAIVSVTTILVLSIWFSTNAIGPALSGRRASLRLTFRGSPSPFRPVSS